jgi:hypothetical protein
MREEGEAEGVAKAAKWVGERRPKGGGWQRRPNEPLGTLVAKYQRVIVP